MKLVLLICGIYWIIFSFINRTQNVKSAIFYKVLPFFTGLAEIICAADLYGWVNVF